MPAGGSAHVLFVQLRPPRQFGPFMASHVEPAFGSAAQLPLLQYAKPTQVAPVVVPIVSHVAPTDTFCVHFVVLWSQ